MFSARVMSLLLENLSIALLHFPAAFSTETPPTATLQLPHKILEVITPWHALKSMSLISSMALKVLSMGIDLSTIGTIYDCHILGTSTQRRECSSITTLSHVHERLCSRLLHWFHFSKDISKFDAQFTLGDVEYKRGRLGFVLQGDTLERFGPGLWIRCRWK